MTIPWMQYAQRSFKDQDITGFSCLCRVAWAISTVTSDWEIRSVVRNLKKESEECVQIIEQSHI